MKLILFFSRTKVGGLGKTVGDTTTGLTGTLGDTAKGAGNTIKDTTGAGTGGKDTGDSIGGKKQDGQNPLGL